MKAATEAVYLPLLFLTVALLGGLRVDDRADVRAARRCSRSCSGMMLFGVLVRGRVLAPERLMSASRTPLENLNGLVVILSTFFAATQVFNLVTPESGLPFLLFNVFLFVLLVNTLAGVSRSRVCAAQHGRHRRRRIHPEVHRARRDLRSGRRRSLKRVLYVLLEGVTLGTLTQPGSTPSPAISRLRRWCCFSSALRCCPRGRAAWR